MNERINAQNGVFVYFQDQSQALEILTTPSELRKVVISGEAKKDILVSLYSMGIGKTQIYPELSSVAKDILTEHEIKTYSSEEG